MAYAKVSLESIDDVLNSEDTFFFFKIPFLKAEFKCLLLTIAVVSQGDQYKVNLLLMESGFKASTNTSWC